MDIGKVARVLALVGLLLLLGCPTSTPWTPDDDDDDDSAATDDDDVTGDDDTYQDPVPRIFDMTFVPAMVDEHCFVHLGWSCQDGDGDLASPDDLIYAWTDFSGEQYIWPLNLGNEPLFATPMSVELMVTMDAGVPFIQPGTEVDVTIYIQDIAGNESNHLLEHGYVAPGADCI
jgi:hypothetical protein